MKKVFVLGIFLLCMNCFNLNLLKKEQFNYQNSAELARQQTALMEKYANKIVVKNGWEPIF